MRIWTSLERMASRRHAFRHLAAWAAIFLVAFSGVAERVVSAATLAEWNFTGESSPVSSVADIIDPGLISGITLTRGPGAASSTASNSFRTTGFQNNGIATSNTDYFQFTMTAAAGQSVSISSINAAVAGTATYAASPGVSNQFAYSTDGLNFTLIGSPTVVVGTPGTIAPIATTGISALQNVSASTTLTFRYYASGQTGTGGWGFNSPNSTTAGLTVLGTTQAASGSTSLYWTANGSSLGGSGTWNTSASTWSQSDQTVTGAAWDATKLATFGGTAGTVTVDAVAAERGITFTADGYSLTGGTISLAGASSNPINVAAASTATIASVLQGTTGVLKQGDGRLLLSGTNTFSGNVAMSSGTLQIASDSALGATTNDLILNGTLTTTSSIALDTARDVSGGASLDIAPGTTLTVNGAMNTSATTLTNVGTLSLQGANRTVGTLTINAAGTLNAAGSISAASITASGLTGSTATVNPEVAFSAAGNKTVHVPAGTLVLAGSLSNMASSASSYLIKTGSGTLALRGGLLAGTSSASGGVQIGYAGSSPTDGGTVVLSTGTGAGDGASQLRVNFGTLRSDATGGLVGGNAIAAGLNVAGRTGSLAIIDGSEPITFNGQSSFFRATGTSGELRLNVNNTTTLAGGFAATSGSGTATGITVGGTGTLVLGGDGGALVDTITTADSVRLTLGSTSVLGGGVTVGATNVLNGSGRVAGAIAGAGSVQPGTSSGPGILTAGQLNPTAGTNFMLKFTGAAPNYASATASVNDVVRVTGATPLTAAMTSASDIDLFFGVTTISAGNSFEGGFFTDTAADFASLIAPATVNYYVLGNGAGTDATLAGQGYYSFANWKTSSGADPLLSLNLATTARTANFTGTDVNGQAMIVTAVPEPSATILGLAAAGLLAVGLFRRRSAGERHPTPTAAG
jgi:autotransporter-associated beta strand protein